MFKQTFNHLCMSSVNKTYDSCTNTAHKYCIYFTGFDVKIGRYKTLKNMTP